jgi:O-succinylbenzoic acid--CoA ligase
MERADLARILLGAWPTVATPRDEVVVEQREPARFRTAFSEAVASGGTVFLSNPDWGATERAHFNALRVASDRALTTQSPTSDRQNPHSKHNFGWLCIPTGGSSGKIKLARHDQDTLHAAVRGFAKHFGVARVNALGLLPLHHVGGLMGWLRAELTGGKFLDGDWKAISSGTLPVLPEVPDGWFLSLVPTQLSRLLTQSAAVAWLRSFRAVLVGGGPAWLELAEAGAAARVPLAFTYGATETVAAVAALRPEQFLAGARGCGSMLPHARISARREVLATQSPINNRQPPTFGTNTETLISGVAFEDSMNVGEEEIAVEAESLFRGYWPTWREPGAWRTGDKGFFDLNGSLRVLGRRDALVITGGEKVEPNEVEAVLRASGEFTDVAVVGVSDTEWGEVVVACYPADGLRADGVNATHVATALTGLAAFKRPKKILALADWPRDAAGKLDRGRLAALAQAAMAVQ